MQIQGQTGEGERVRPPVVVKTQKQISELERKHAITLLNGRVSPAGKQKDPVTAYQQAKAQLVEAAENHLATVQSITYDEWASAYLDRAFRQKRRGGGRHLEE